VNLCWAFGQLLAAGVLQGFAEGTDERAYRIPFAIQWIFPLPIFAIIWFCPESPWWLVRKGRMDEARRAIRNLTSKNSPTSADETIALIQHTIRIEEESETGTSYLDCFKGVDLRRTEIICMTFAAQVWCGSPLGGAPVYFFVNAGLSPANAFKFNVGGLGLASIGTIISWALLGRFGRRTLYVYGLGLLAATLLTTGAVAAGAGTGSTSSYIQAAFVVLWLLCYYLTVGPVCYAIISEMSAVRLRNKSVCISRIAYYLSQIVGNVIQPYMINPNAANWQGKTAFFWAGTCLLFFLWAFFRLPESKDRSYEQLDILFNEHVGARQFAKMQVNAYAPRGERVKVA
jgi:SP family general alpha glucoside:H+ symporter-like MFS transporter